MNAWQRIVETIPSRHMPPGCALTGCREALASHAYCIHPLRYLEVGCRRGHSLAVVALAAGPHLESALAVDLWIENYGDEPNEGPDQVMSRLGALGVDIWKIRLLTGDSHELLPRLRQTFNLILVDGDHTAEGAAADLRDCFALLEPDGVLVFDDATPELLPAWRGVTEQRADLQCHEALDATPPFCVAVKQ
jgi:SAM-dependent methyltransferase